VANCSIPATLFTRRSFDHEPWSNVHRHQLLEEQLGGIRKLHLRYLSFVLAALALKSVVAQVGNGNQTTQVAYMKSVWIRYFKEPLPQELMSMNIAPRLMVE
jgi:hypothetical protein